jgi:hypothetical protein
MVYCALFALLSRAISSVKVNHRSLPEQAGANRTCLFFSGDL